MMKKFLGQGNFQLTLLHGTSCCVSG